MLDIELVLQHIKADAEDIEAALIEQYLASAVSSCENYCNRRIYADIDAKNDDYGVALSDLEAAHTERDAVLNVSENCDVREAAINRYNQKKHAVKRRLVGVVLDDTISAAILMMVGHFYRNRQEVVVTQGNVAQIPAGAKRLLEPYLWVGNLGG